MSNRKKKNSGMYAVGDKVELLKKEKKKYLVGMIKYIGKIYRKQGIWYGIELDKPVKTAKTSNGTYQNIQYFICADNKALFVQDTQINKKIASSKKKSSLFIGKKVSVKCVECNGIIKYIGEHQITKAASKNKKSVSKKKKPIRTKHVIYYGIELENPVGNCNGKYAANNVQYFKCGNKYGIFVTRKDIGSAYIDYDKNELLLCGFIKTVDSMDVLIPEDIIILCIKFFIIDNRLHNHILSWYITYKTQNRAEDSYDEAELIDMSNAKAYIKSYKFRFYWPWVDETLIQFISSEWSRYGIYYNLKQSVCDEVKKNISDIWHVETKVNSVLIRSGGYDGKRGGTGTDCWFFDSNDIYNNNDNMINGYLYKMPIVNQQHNMDIISKHCFLFDKFNNFMYMFGGGGYDDDDGRWFGSGGVWRLNLNQIGNV
eukprot:317950_1